MSNLFISFLIAIIGAISLVVVSREFDLEFYTSRIFPLIPIFYAIVYQIFEKLQTGKTKPIPPSKAKEEMKAGAAVMFRNITPGRIAIAVGISFGIKFTFEIIFTALFLYFSGQTFEKLYGGFGMEILGRFLRGDHPWLTGNEGISLLVLLAIATSFGTGLWIGYTTRARAILEGVIVGAVVSLIGAITNMLILYRRIEEMANQMAASLGYAVRIGFVAVITTQVLLYGLWSGVAQKAKEEREANASLKKAAKASRKKK
jgi:hypothetical protein